MTFSRYPRHPRLHWRRLDTLGHEDAQIDRTDTGWLLTGDVYVQEAGVTAQLKYTVTCDLEWRTRLVVVHGQEGHRSVHFELAADGAGQWTRDGVSIHELAGALDIDLAFTPATNLLPIRRLALAIGSSASVRSAWLRFPNLRLEPLEQRYTRRADRQFQYEARIDNAVFSARLDADDFGRVIRYEGLWEAAPR